MRKNLSSESQGQSRRVKGEARRAIWLKLKEASDLKKKYGMVRALKCWELPGHLGTIERACRQLKKSSVNTH